MTSASTWWRLAGGWLFFASFCYQKGEKKIKRQSKLIEAVTQPRTATCGVFLIPQSAMGCTCAAIKHYLDMFFRAEALRSISNHLGIIIPTSNLGKQVPRERYAPGFLAGWSNHFSKPLSKTTIFKTHQSISVLTARFLRGEQAALERIGCWDSSWQGPTSRFQGSLHLFGLK